MEGSARSTAVIIEDEETIQQLVRRVIEQIGLDVIAVSNGTDGVEAVRAHEPSVVILDVNMPGIDGFETAKRIRAISASYIIMLTARDEEIDALQGLASGADDYVLKPFRPRELRARIEAMLRRSRLVAGSAQQSTAVSAPEAAVPVTTSPTAVWPSRVGAAVDDEQDAPQPYSEPTRSSGNWTEHNGLRLDPDSRLVELDGEDVELTRSEFDLLRALLETQRRVRSKSDLALLLRGESYVTSHYVSEADRRGVEVHIANLRKKLHENPAQPRIIETVRGVGYRLTAPLN